MTGIVVAAVVVASLALAALVVYIGNGMVRAGGATGGGFADGLGMALDVFDPAQGRARQELEDQKHQGAIIPSTDGEDPPVTVDLGAGRARIRRATP